MPLAISITGRAVRKGGVKTPAGADSSTRAPSASSCSALDITPAGPSPSRTRRTAMDR